MELDRQQKYIFTLEDVLSSSECEQLISRIESLGPTTAPINTAMGTTVKLGVRNNERVMFDDESLAQDLYMRIKQLLPQTIHGMNICGFNERFRGYRYQQGMRFAPHSDGAFIRNDDEQSWYTFIAYLNQDFEGGNTTFLVKPEVSIEPHTGMALLFQHPLIHEGSEVTQGTKYVLRSDIMYRTPSIE